MESVEAFLQVKTLFLLLQTLFELRQCEPAQPILFLLEVKFEDFKHIIKQKQLIKAVQEPGTSQPNSIQTDGNDEAAASGDIEGMAAA